MITKELDAKSSYVADRFIVFTIASLVLLTPSILFVLINSVLVRDLSLFSYFLVSILLLNIFAGLQIVLVIVVILTSYIYLATGPNVAELQGPLK